MTGNESWWPPRSFLGRLAESDREALLRLGNPYRTSPGTRVVGQGDPSRHIVIVLTGYVKVTTATPDDQEVLLAVRGRGDIIGELAAISGNVRTATVTACGHVEGRVVTHTAFEGFLNGHPAASRQLTSIVGDKLLWANRRRGDFVTASPRCRVARVLYDLVDVFTEPSDTAGRLRLGVTQLELASIAGVREVTVQRILREFRATGVVGTGYRGVTIDNPAALRDLCEFAPGDMDRAG